MILEKDLGISVQRVRERTPRAILAMKGEAVAA